MAMNNAAEDRLKFNRQIMDFYGPCQHKAIGQRMIAIPETDDVEYVNACLDCGTDLN